MKIHVINYKKLGYASTKNLTIRWFPDWSKIIKWKLLSLGEIKKKQLSERDVNKHYNSWIEYESLQIEQ